MDPPDSYSYHRNTSSDGYYPDPRSQQHSRPRPSPAAPARSPQPQQEDYRGKFCTPSPPCLLPRYQLSLALPSASPPGRADLVRSLSSLLPNLLQTTTPNSPPTQHTRSRVLLLLCPPRPSPQIPTQTTAPHQPRPLSALLLPALNPRKLGHPSTSNSNNSSLNILLTSIPSRGRRRQTESTATVRSGQGVRVRATSRRARGEGCTRRRE